MIKSGIFLLLFFFVSATLWAQAEIFISDENKNISKVDIAAGNCTKTVVVNTGSNLSDITLHPDGNMYGCSFTARKIYRVNMTTGALTELTTITAASRLVGMTADANGLIYVTEGNVVPSRLFVYDPVANTYESRGFLADGSAGDLTWYFGNLYNASDNNKLVKVNVNNAANSVVVGPFSGVVKAGDRIFALVTVIEDCGNSATYGLSEKGDYYRIDMATAIVDRLCVDNVDLYGSTSADEFNASECFLNLDLDKNNSTGALGSNFNTDFSCQPSAMAPIADIDVDVEVANLVDSIVIEIISGALNGISEFLSVGTTTNINSNNLAQKISGISNGSASTTNFEAFLSSMRYNNTAFPIIEGDRTIRVIGYSEGKSDTGFATISIIDDVEAGNDGTISFCSSDAPANLFNSLSGSPDAGGTWMPNLNSNSGVFDPAIDPAGVYNYIVSDGCFRDSAKVTVSVASSSTFDLGNDTTICFGNSFTLNADVGNLSATYLWNNGATDSAIVVTTSGNYSVTVNIGTCQVTDNINVTFVDFQLQLGNDVSVCPGDSVLIGDNIGQAGATYLWNTGATTAEIYASTVGNYSVEVSLQSCKKTDDIDITAASGTTIPVDLGNDTTICPGNNLVLSSGYSTAVYDHLWSNGSTSANITVTAPGTYSVTINNGCQTGSDTIVVSPAPTTTIPLNLGADITICEGQTASLTSSYSAPEYSLQWSTGSTTETIVVSTAGIYGLTVTGNCETGTDAIEVFTIDCDTIPTDTTTIDTTIIPIDTTDFYYCEIVMPSAFTPNGDNANDLFAPVNVCEGFLSYELYIYNRYGELIFKGSDQAWDGTFKGKEAPMDNFIWYAIYFYESDKIVTERGNIVLLR